MTSNPNIRLTKKSLLELIEKFPEDTPIVVSTGYNHVNVPEGIASGRLLGVTENRAAVWSVGNDTDFINLEL